MYRIRAVESPPDEKGARTIWHRGTSGAELVSWVDAAGHVTRQELSLFEETITWDRSLGLQTGVTKEGDGSKAMKPSDAMIVDDASAVRLERVGRARAALAEYTGDDKFIAHLRQIVTDAGDGNALGAFHEVTRSANTVRLDLAKAANAPRATAPSPWPWLVVAAVALTIALLLVLFAR